MGHTILTNNDYFVGHTAMTLLRPFVYPEDIRLVAYKNKVCKFYLYFAGGFCNGISSDVQNDIEIAISSILSGIPSNIDYINTKYVRVKLDRKRWSLENHQDIILQCSNKQNVQSSFSYKLYITFNQVPKNRKNESVTQLNCKISSFEETDPLDEEENIDVEEIHDIEPKVLLKKTELKDVQDDMDFKEKDRNTSDNTVFNEKLPINSTRPIYGSCIIA